LTGRLREAWSVFFFLLSPNGRELASVTEIFFLRPPLLFHSCDLPPFDRFPSCKSPHSTFPFDSSFLPPPFLDLINPLPHTIHQPPESLLYPPEAPLCLPYNFLDFNLVLFPLLLIRLAAVRGKESCVSFFFFSLLPSVPSAARLDFHLAPLASLRADTLLPSLFPANRFGILKTRRKSHFRLFFFPLPLVSSMPPAVFFAFSGPSLPPPFCANFREVHAYFLWIVDPFELVVPASFPVLRSVSSLSRFFQSVLWFQAS